MIKRYLEGIFYHAAADYRRAILALAAARPADTLLDLGCDTGDLTEEVARAAHARRVYGIDIIPERYRASIQRGIKVVESNLDASWPFANASMDLVHANQVIEHMVALDGFVSEIARVLKPGGCAIVCTENLASWHNVGALVLGFQPFSLTNISRKGVVGNPLGLHHGAAEGEWLLGLPSFHHTRVLSYRGLRHIFELHGLLVEQVIGSGYYPLPGWLARLAARWDPRHAAFLTLLIRKP